MPLSPSQHNRNKAELTDFVRARFIQLNEEKSINLEEEILKACEGPEIVINTDLQEGMDALHLVLRSEALGKKEVSLISLRARLKAWAEHYKKLVADASVRLRQMFAAQPRGILRGLRDNKKVEDAAWCEDLDVYESLKEVMVDPRQVNASGAYILPPVSISQSSFLQEHLVTVLKKEIKDGPVKLLIPLNQGGHWRLAIILIDKNHIESAVLWDSMDNSKLKEHISYQNMHKAVKDAVQEYHQFSEVLPLAEKRIAEEIKSREDKGEVLVEATKAAIKKVLTEKTVAESASRLAKTAIDASSKMKAQAVGIQTNYWSCGDFVIQKCLKEKGNLSSATAKAIEAVSAQNPALLRQALIAQVIKNNEQLHLTTPALTADKVMDDKCKKEEKAAVYDDPEHSAYIAFEDWTLVGSVFKKQLNPSAIEIVGLADHEKNFFVAPNATRAGLQAAGSPVTEEDLKAIAAGNQLILEGLKSVLKRLPENQMFYQQLNICDIETYTTQAQSHVVSIGIKKTKTKVELSLYESYPVDEAQRAHQAKAWQTILQKGLPGCEITVIPRPVEAQQGADCTLHAVFNAVKQEYQLSGPALSKDECGALRKALDETNKVKNTSALEATVSKVLKKRKQATATYLAAQQASIFQMEFDKIFNEAINEALAFLTTPANPNLAAKKEFVQALEALRKQTLDDVRDGSLTSEEATAIATSTKELCKAVTTNQPLEIAKGIESFEKTTFSYKKSSIWRPILGAVVGAVLGILLGAMIGILAGPAGALIALAACVKGAMLGATFFGMGGLLSGTGLGLWQNKRIQHEDPLIIAARETAECAKKLSLTPVKS